MENTAAQLNGRLNGPSGLVFSDTTIREGEQCPGVSFTIEEKIKMLHMLDEAGIHQVQLYPGKTNESRAVVERLREEEVECKIMVQALGFEDSWLENAKYAVDSGTEVAHMSFYATPHVNPYWNSGTDQQTKDRIATVVEYYRSQLDVPVEICLIDATRARLDHLMTLVEIAAQSGAHRITLADTVGSASPEGYGRLVELGCATASPYGATIGLHCHNDLGLALANTFAGIRSGATLVDVAVNGLGDRAGNAALAEVAVGLKVLYGIETDLRLDKLLELSSYFAQSSGRPIPVNQPLVGELAFADQDDYHIDALTKNPLAFRAFDSADIGSPRRVMFGKRTGFAAISYMAEKYSRPISRELAERVRDALYREADRLPKGQYIDEAMFWRIIDQIDDSSNVRVGSTG